jgi:mono/diheme cytochrome c family protein
MRLGKAEIAGASPAPGVRSAVPRSWRLIQLASLAFLVGCAAIGAGCRGITSPEAEASPARDAARFQLGRPVTAAEIAAWDLDVMPNGEGLPDGGGNVASGETLYIAQCQHCHGAKGKGKPFDQLAGRIAGDAFPFASDPRAPKTIGSYWPYATTLFDYVRRAMPLERPGSLSDEDVYSLTAYLLHLNDLIDAETRLDRENLPKVVMPSRDRFVLDDRSGGGEIR